VPYIVSFESLGLEFPQFLVNSEVTLLGHQALIVGFNNVSLKWAKWNAAEVNFFE